MNILEQMWYGNVAPKEYDAAPTEKYRETIRLMGRNEEKLLKTMADAQKALFTRFIDSQREYHTLAECLLFQNSFRLGARIMLEVMAEA